MFSRPTLRTFGAAPALLCLLAGGACQTRVPTLPTPAAPLPPASGPVSFSARIQPIFDARCTDCHRDGGVAAVFGIRMRLTAGQAFAALVNQSSSQRPNLTLVLPGDAEASLLFQKVLSDSPPVGVRMPQFAAPLSAEQIALIRDWINQGAANN